MSRFAAPIAEQIWDMKYRFKQADGTPIDLTVEDTWRRIARSLAVVEKDPAKWEDKFYSALEDFKYLPAGRITAGAGTERSVTLFNCFVMGTIPDSMGGIFDMLKEAALTMQQGGGIGYDFSTIRPKGADVKGVAADASGPLSFMDVWDAMCRTIMSAGSRRGAMMATMRCDHPDIEDFITAKSDPVRLRMFNMSVLVTDDFMKAVKADASWDLQFEGRVYHTIEARDLWNKIMQSTYDYAEPGVIFIDRINAMNNLNYVETISATNPCVTDDTWVSTTDGPRQVTDLIGTPFTALVDGTPHHSGPKGFFKTGHKPVKQLKTECRRTLRLTADHLVRRVASKTRWHLDTEWTTAADLNPGDEVIIHNHQDVSWGTGCDSDLGYLLGALIGDGMIKDDKAVISVWTQAACMNGDPVALDPVMTHIEALLRQMPARADFAGWTTIADRNEHRISTAALKTFAADYGVVAGNKTLTDAIERAPADFGAAVLRGLFDADGSVQGTQAKGVSVRLAQSDLALLQRAQRMLARLGINAKIYENRRTEGHRPIPDGYGGSALYPHKAQHELIIAGSNLAVFQDRIGFLNADKHTRLMSLMTGYKRALNREHFTAVVAEVTDDGNEDVYDVQIPGINAFDANGFYVHNCGEQPLPPYGACLLGSVNLARLVDNPFEEDAALDQEALDDLVATAVRMMDNVVDASRFPLDAQAAEAQAKRRIGLGVTGLADALLMVGLRYGSDEAAAQTERWMRQIARAAYLASVDLAREKGAFPLFDADKFLATGHMQDMDDDVRAAIAEHGIRNALLTSIAPTGTISLYAGNVSSGIEPVFAYAYTRKVLQKDGSRTEEEVVDYAVQLWREKFGDAPLPDYFVNAQTLPPLDHVKMQAAAQKWVDSSISKTINCPEDIGFDDFKDVYMQAWDTGCKGCTTYRPNDVTGSVLSVSEKDEAPLSEAPEQVRGDGEVVYISEPLDRPQELEGSTYKLKWPDSEHAIYITINDIVLNGHRRPFEVFINSKNMEHFAWTVALTRMISAVFRRGGDVSFVVEELKAVFDPRGGAWMSGKYVPSILAAIGGVIERHLITIGFIDGEGMGLKTDPQAAVVNLNGPRGKACPNCGSYDLRMIEGCMTCGSCGHSKCQ
ncbi:LAGLIDADG family homing endonuclease [Pseudaestuariivita rosea]|uniref:LAGLIDADG family homing endonuclease n=1 Tax=Pseudaestuariivita rosea TaxID=2763263 RepID=UPI001ABAED30|nr:LAGLIDADG family homing endonuclease [Pseudaestuariivita rosea]